MKNQSLVSNYLPKKAAAEKLIQVWIDKRLEKEVQTKRKKLHLTWRDVVIAGLRKFADES